MTSGPLPARDARRATLLDVARRAGVSTATVSNAHRHPERLAPELLERVLRTAAALGYHPDPVARGLRLGATGAVGVLYRDELPHAFADPAFSRFLEGVAQGLAE